LREDEDAPPVNESVSGDDAVAGIDLAVETEIVRAVNYKLIELLERPFVEKKVNPRARGHFPGGVLALDAFTPAALTGLGLTLT